MDYDEMIQSLTCRGESSMANLCRARKAAITAALMTEVAEPWRHAFITDSPLAGLSPHLLTQALREAISPAELGEAIMDGAIEYAAGRIERDLQRTRVRCE